jgi:predicted nucleotide-binding protein
MLVGAGLMADVFISYSKSYVQITRDLAADLEAKGLTVWWDTDLLAGESFRQRIIQELQACKAAIVIWTPQSVISDYVISEAERARKAGKLIQV